MESYSIGGTKSMNLIPTLLWLLPDIQNKASKYSTAMDVEVIDFYSSGMDLLTSITNMTAFALGSGTKRWRKKQVDSFLYSI